MTPVIAPLRPDEGENTLLGEATPGLDWSERGQKSDSVLGQMSEGRFENQVRRVADWRATTLSLVYTPRGT
ncbi:MAG: hypothetical protein ACLPYY_03370 [Acidimicrobiales bacterium]